jgi:hypothetical protein
MTDGQYKGHCTDYARKRFAHQERNLSQKTGIIVYNLRNPIFGDPHVKYIYFQSPPCQAQVVTAA